LIILEGTFLAVYEVFAAAFEHCSLPISTLVAVCGRVLVCVSVEPLLQQGWTILVIL